MLNCYLSGHTNLHDYKEFIRENQDTCSFQHLASLDFLIFCQVNDYFPNFFSDNLLLVHRNATDFYKNATFSVLILYFTSLLNEFISSCLWSL